MNAPMEICGQYVYSGDDFNRKNRNYTWEFDGKGMEDKINLTIINRDYSGEQEDGASNPSSSSSSSSSASAGSSCSSSASAGSSCSMETAPRATTITITTAAADAAEAEEDADEYAGRSSLFEKRKYNEY